MTIPVQRILVRTFLGLTLASSACGQAQRITNADRLRSQTILTQADVHPIPTEIAQRFQALHSVVQPSVNAWVQQQAHIVAQQPAPNMAALEAAIRNRFSDPKAPRDPNPKAMSANGGTLGGLQDADIEALAFIVMMQATNDMDQDLKSMMQEVQEHNQRKRALREMLDGLNQARSQASNSNPNLFCTTPACQALLGKLRQFSATADQLPRPVRLSATNRVTYGDLSALQQQMKDNLDSMNEMSETESLRLQMAMDRRSKFLEALSNLLKKMGDANSTIVQNLK
jgi:hypothetical protein